MSSQVPGDSEDLHDRSLGELLKQLSEQTTRLVHQALELAKAELTQKGRQAGTGAGLFGGAGAFGRAALGALTACFILVLNAVVPAWLAALIVAVVYGIIAYVLVMRGEPKLRAWMLLHFFSLLPYALTMTLSPSLVSPHVADILFRISGSWIPMAAAG